MSILPVSQPESLGFCSKRLARVRANFQRYIDQNKIAGAISLIARHGQVAQFECAGEMELETQRPMTLDTIFRIYSMSKPITSAAAMMLLEEGLFRLDDPLADYIPWFKDVKVLVSQPNSDFATEKPKRPISIRDLFTHTAGLSYGFEEHSYLDDQYRKHVWQVMDKKGLDLAGMVKNISELPLAFHPGTAFRYSLSIDVLGYLVQVLSGKPFEQFLQERIFDPLNMPDTGFCLPPEKVQRLAACYQPAEKGGLKLTEPVLDNRYTHPVKAPSGGGGLVSTASDYYQFASMLLHGGQWQGERLLGRKTVEWMRQNHLPAGLYSFNEPWAGFGLGGNVAIDPAKAPFICSLGRFGWGGAASTKFWIDPQEDLLAIFMVQLMPSDIYPVATDFNNLVYQALID